MMVRNSKKGQKLLRILKINLSPQMVGTTHDQGNFQF